MANTVVVKVSKKSNVVLAVHASVKNKVGTIECAVSLDGSVIRSMKGDCSGEVGPNEAYWEGVVRAIKYMSAPERNTVPCTITCPNVLVINQLNKKAKIIMPSLKQYRNLANDFLGTRPAPINFVLA